MDEFARDSHAKAYAAQENSWFEEEYAPIELDGNVLDHDETIRLCLVWYRMYRPVRNVTEQVR